jgi:hypothetical protein
LLKKIAQKAGNEF